MLLDVVDFGVLTFGRFFPVCGRDGGALTLGFGVGEALTRGLTVRFGIGFVVVLDVGPLPRRPSITNRPSFTYTSMHVLISQSPALAGLVGEMSRHVITSPINVKVLLNIVARVN